MNPHEGAARAEKMDRLCRVLRPVGNGMSEPAFAEFLGSLTARDWVTIAKLAKCKLPSPTTISAVQASLMADYETEEQYDPID